MNISESIKHVLKNERQNFFASFWKDDVGLVAREISQDFFQFLKQGDRLRRQKFSASLKQFKETGQDTLGILKVIPLRIKKGFDFFKEDLLHELEMQPDPKHRALFSMKVIGALASFSLGSFYSVKQARLQSSFPGKKAISQFLISQLVFKISRLFILRFIEEIEKQITEKEDLQNIQYFKSIIASTDLDREDASVNTHGDEAVAIVDALRTYILTGQRVGILD